MGILVESELSVAMDCQEERKVAMFCLWMPMVWLEEDLVPVFWQEEEFVPMFGRERMLLRLTMTHHELVNLWLWFQRYTRYLGSLQG